MRPRVTLPYHRTAEHPRTLTPLKRFIQTGTYVIVALPENSATCKKYIYIAPNTHPTLIHTTINNVSCLAFQDMTGLPVFSAHNSWRRYVTTSRDTRRRDRGTLRPAHFFQVWAAMTRPGTSWAQHTLRTSLHTRKTADYFCVLPCRAT